MSELIGVGIACVWFGCVIGALIVAYVWYCDINETQDEGETDD